MQRQQDVIGFFPETVKFDHESTLGSTVIDQQVCWNNMQNPGGGNQGSYVISPTHLSNACVGSSNQERLVLGQSSSDESSKNQSYDHQLHEHGWSSSTADLAGSGSRSEGDSYESESILSLDIVNANHQYMNTNTNSNPYDLDLNDGLVGIAGGHHQANDDTVMENGGILPVGVFDDQSLVCGSGGYIVENSDPLPSSSIGTRQSCKRKAIDIGKPSELPGSNLHGGFLSDLNVGSSSNSPFVSQELSHKFVLPSVTTSDSALVQHGDTSHRNFRLRLNPLHQESLYPPFLPSGSAVRHPAVDFHSSPVMNPTIPQNQTVTPIHHLRHSVPAFRFNERCRLRSGSSSNPITVDDGVDGISQNTNRSFWEPPLFVPPELRNLMRSHSSNRNVAGTAVFGNVSSSLPYESLQGVHFPASTWVPYSNPHRNSQRLSDYVRRSLFSSGGGDSRRRSRSHPSLHSSPLPEETVLSSETGNMGPGSSFIRMRSWLERHGDMLGFQQSPQNLSPPSEGRSRIVVSELRNLLNLMRRSESLRLEDVMILDHSVLLGMADAHDTHRDMRLDVDNMSYEELLALEERIGNVNTGLSEEAILKSIMQWKWSIVGVTQMDTEPCCICREDYKDGQDLGRLDCGHDFHTNCIKQWLMIKNWCPVCKTTGLAAGEA